MTQTQQTESAERIARPLIQLAKLNGISTSYIDQLGTYVEIRDEVLVSVLAALGVDASSDEAITASYAATQQRIADTLVEPTVVKFIGKEAVTPIRAKGNDVALKLTLEDGTEYAGDLTAYLTGSNADDGSLQLTLPDDIPAGYHTLAVDAGPLHAEAALICAPARIELPPAVAEKQRWGWMAQMYSIRSAESWGVGDYGDLKLLLSDAATKSHADFMLINPIHATAPVPPLEPSPYLPESRRFLNVTYIRPQDIAEYAELNEADQAEVTRLHAEVSPANDSIEPLDINDAPAGAGPARYWHFPGAAGTVGFISAMSNHFCASCNRLRLTADGNVRPCLFSDAEYSVREALRRGDDMQVLSIWRDAVAHKPQEHAIIEGTQRFMSQIGG